MQTHNVELVKAATNPYQTDGLNVEEWLSNPKNIALTNEDGDIALFEYEIPGVVTGHYFFNSRARQAVKAATNFLDEVFKEEYNIKIVRGLTPLEKLGARWLNKQLKLKSYGVVQTASGPCELIIITRDEWKDLING